MPADRPAGHREGRYVVDGAAPANTKSPLYARRFPGTFNEKRLSHGAFCRLCSHGKGGFVPRQGHTAVSGTLRATLAPAPESKARVDKVRPSRGLGGCVPLRYVPVRSVSARIQIVCSSRLRERLCRSGFPTSSQPLRTGTLDGFHRLCGHVGRPRQRPPGGALLLWTSGPRSSSTCASTALP